MFMPRGVEVLGPNPLYLNIYVYKYVCICIALPERICECNSGLSGGGLGRGNRLFLYSFVPFEFSNTNFLIFQASMTFSIKMGESFKKCCETELHEVFLSRTLKWVEMDFLFRSLVEEGAASRPPHPAALHGQQLVA